MTRAAVYLRLSKETEASSSIERQRLACLRLAESRGWDVVLVEEDVDVSASKRRLDRPGLDRVRAAYGSLDVVIYWKTDRLARSLLDFANLMEEAERHDVALVSATEPLDLSSPMGRAMGQVVAIFAELEARTMGLRQVSTIAHLRETGRSTGGLLPYWLRRVPNPDGPGYVDDHDPERAPVVLEAVERALAGESLLAIARDFTARGLPTIRGGRAWSPDTLGGLLRNPALRGYVVHRGQVVRGPDGLPRVSRPPLVDGRTWQALQTELDRRRQPKERRWASETLLGGLATCAHCRSPLYARSQRGRHGLLLSYACSSRSIGRACPGCLVSRPRLDEYVSETFLAAVGPLPVVRLVEEPVEADEAALEDVRAAMADLEADRYERGLFRGDQGAARFSDLYGRLEARLATLEKATRLRAAPRMEETGETFRQAWDREEVAGRRALLSSALVDVMVRKGTPGRHGLDPERVGLVWRGEEGDDPAHLED